MVQRLAGLAGAMLLAAGAAQAQGFAVSDLTQVQVDTSVFDAAATESAEFETLPKPQQLMVACLDCTRTVVVNLRLGQGDAQTETDLRNGTMSQDILTSACSEATGEITCLDVNMVEVGEAVGWVMRTQSGKDRFLKTYELFLDGDSLSVQAIAESRDEADAIGQTAFDDVVPKIVLGGDG